MLLLTTISQPITQIAQKAVSVLIAMINGELYKNITNLPTSLYQDGNENNVL